MKLGYIVEVEFLDHSQDDLENTEPMTCRVWGKLIKITPKVLVIQTWELSGDVVNEDEKKSNAEIFKILRSTLIKKVRFLGRASQG